MKPFMIYMVGISGSGKTTLAQALDDRLKDKCKIQFIDGDVIRSQIGDLFGYTFEERMKNNRVVRVIVDYLLKNGISVILAQVAGYEIMRDAVRQEFQNDYEYMEVYVKCSLAECMRRDVKGYYKLESAGKLDNLNGANDTFEIPKSPEIVIDTEKASVDDGVEEIMMYLRNAGYDI